MSKTTKKTNQAKEEKPIKYWNPPYSPDTPPKNINPYENRLPSPKKGSSPSPYEGVSQSQDEGQLPSPDMPLPYEEKSRAPYKGQSPPTEYDNPYGNEEAPARASASAPARAPASARAPAPALANITQKNTSNVGNDSRAPKKTHNENNMIELLNLYLKNVTKGSPEEALELEVKFGTMRDGKPITRINYDNVVKKLLSTGFIIEENVSLLRIQNEYKDIKTGLTRLSKIRTEISGMQNIRKYCQTNDINQMDSGVTFIKKEQFNDGSNLRNSVDMNDFNFRISLNKESKLEKTFSLVRTMLTNWKEQRKTFRYINRYKLRFHDKKLPFTIDMSIVKESKKQGRYYVSEYNIHDSEVFTAPEKYEIEIEVINEQVGMGTIINTSENLNKTLKPVIKYVLAGLQETNYPVGYSEQNEILRDYMRLIFAKDYKETMRVTSDQFIGPSSYTLERVNIKPITAETNLPNIRENYTVTDKADGDRKLLFISPTNGKIYLINTNMEVQFTGSVTQTKELWNTLIDGEHVLYDKNNKFINMYAAFDIYYIAGVDIRTYEFVPINPTEETQTPKKYRLPLMERAIDDIKAKSVMKNTNPSPLLITKKRFYIASATQTIFQCCGYILKKEHDGIFEYKTDGLIFTPANRGVKLDKDGSYKKKITWDYSFKWKPAEFNTIDFLISVKKNASGLADEIRTVFQDGTDVSSVVQIMEYKTLILRVGFDETNPKHAFMNPSQDAIDDKIPVYNNEKERYVPMRFYPTEPEDPQAGLCNIYLNDSDKQMLSEANEIIEDNMIVEFRYDISKPELWRWIPLRVRYDKTAQLRAGEKNFGNAYHVANSNWHSIHSPITQLMIMTGEDITEELADDDVYYNKTTGLSKTHGLRDFHNLYVKKQLINSVAKPGMTLIDLAVGKAGDFPKWIDAKLKFIFGVDISRDNIKNRMNGAYARYLRYRNNYNVMPTALFVNGDSRANIRKTTGINDDKDKQITHAVFGQGPKDVKLLGQGVYNQYGIAKDGFDVCSIQFAIHYMFENQETLQNFLRNVSEVTKEGGYFIGTSYDGEEIFKMLKDLPENDSKVIRVDDKKIWEVTKRYDRDEFNDDETCVGYAIDVYQETINKSIREYLVNYKYLTRVLENYGFVLATREDLEKINASFTNGMGMFEELFNKMKTDIKTNTRTKNAYKEAPNMTTSEKAISFLNRYFIYKKTRKVSDVEKVSLHLQHKTITEARDETLNTSMLKKSIMSEKNVPVVASASASASNVTTFKPTMKLHIKKPKPQLSVIPEIPSESLTMAPQAPLIAQQAPLMAPQAPPELEKAKVTKNTSGKKITIKDKTSNK